MLRLRAKKLFALSFMAGILALSGCKVENPTAGSGDGKNKAKQETEKDADTETVDLTEEELRLFCEEYVDDKRIRQGKLYGYQKKALEEFRFAKNYIDAKYPDVEKTYFHHVAISESGTDTGVLQFYIDNDPEKWYEIQINVAADGYVAEDSYTESLYREPYAQKLHALLEDRIEEKFLVTVHIYGCFGEGQDDSLSADEIFMLPNKKDIEIFIDAPAQETERLDGYTALVEEILRQNGQYVYCLIFAAEGLGEYTTRKECMDYVNEIGRNACYQKSFNTFDLRPDGE